MTKNHSENKFLNYFFKLSDAFLDVRKYFRKKIIVSLVTLIESTNSFKRSTLYFFFFISWRLITLQYCSGFCLTLI